jgi:spoIIIJ-associated protein
MAQKQQSIQEKAATVEDAVNAGLAKLGLSRDQVDIEIIDEGRRGVLGIGGREAVVRLSARTAPVVEQTPVEPPVEKRPVKAEVEGKPESEPEAVDVEEPVQVVDVEETQVVEEVLEEGDAQESAVAVDVLESLLDKMNVEAVIEVSMSPEDDLTGRCIPVLNISGEDLGLLIGARGETLDALQHISRLMVGHRIRSRANFVIDVEGYRERREQALARMAERMGKKAIERGTPVTLEPMPAYERRVIHMTLREDPRVRTESTGEGDRRRVRIYPL